MLLLLLLKSCRPTTTKRSIYNCHITFLAVRFVCIYCSTLLRAGYDSLCDRLGESRDYLFRNTRNRSVLAATTLHSERLNIFWPSTDLPTPLHTRSRTDNPRRTQGIASRDDIVDEWSAVGWWRGLGRPHTGPGRATAMAGPADIAAPMSLSLCIKTRRRWLPWSANTRKTHAQARNPWRNAASPRINP